MSLGVAVAATLFFLPGCLVCDQRLPVNETPSADSPLMGLWQSPWPAMQSKESLTVSYVAGQDHYIAVRGRQKYLGKDNRGVPVETLESIAYEAYPSRIGGRLFFSLLSVKGDSNVYAVVEAVLEGGGKKLVLREPVDEAVERAMTGGQLKWRMQEDSKVATSSPEELTAWLGSLQESDFKIHETFERWPAPIDQLNQRLANN